jgi:DMSO/TMAO reductase YedYZ molybdopterin-dependent catalytic subunit
MGTTPPAAPPARGWPVGAAIGLLSGGVAIGAATLVAGLVGTGTSPVLAVGAAAVDASPESVKRFAIDTFGTDDKTALLLGIGIVLAIAAVVLGIVSLRRPRAGVIGLVVLGTIGALAAVTRPSNGLLAAVPSIAGAASGLWAFVWLRGRAGLPPVIERGREPQEPPPAPTGLDRRRFLFGSAVAAGLAVATGFVGEYLVRRADATASRSAVRLPEIADTGKPTPTAADLQVPGELPFITPNDAFYRVDTALFIPAVQTDGWTLNVGGMVDRPLTLTFDDLLARPLVERDVTLACVSNEVGGRYVGNARWTGTLLAPLLVEAGIQPGVTQLVSRSTDGFTTGTPASVALDGRDAMLAVAMNGEPLPLAHGFPVRMVIPGLYGYESACKWIAEIEATTYEAYSAYWVQRGWAERVLIKTESRIDVPKRGATVPAGTVVVAGVAWAQHRGISAVQIQIDGGPWEPAKLGAQDTVDTWRQWRYDWQAVAGAHTITVRATDGDGVVQTEVQAQPFPSGATGWHQIPVTVS